MGTRNLTAVFSDGEYRIAQYGQWDGYPDGQGLTALKFAREHLADDVSIQAFKAKLGRCRFISDEEQRSLYQAVGITGEWMTMDEANKFAESHPQLDRDMAADVLEFVRTSEAPEVMLYNSVDFAADSFMCEWAYVLDLDAGTFEVFKGFNKELLNEGDRFFDEKPERNSGYCQVKLLKAFKLGDLPSDDEFLRQTSGEDEDQ